jgi:transposase
MRNGNWCVCILITMWTSRGITTRFPIVWSSNNWMSASLKTPTIEVFNKGERIASHPRSWLKGGHTTLDAHRPEAHQHYGDWSPERFMSGAEKIGSATRQVITVVLQERRHPEQGYRSCLGILRLAKAYSDDRLEAACTRALLLGTCRCKSIESILKHGLDSKAVVVEEESALPQQHENVRGAEYYH